MKGFSHYKQSLDSILENSFKNKKQFKKNLSVIMGALKYSKPLKEFFIFSDVKWEESFFEANYSDEDKIIMVNNNSSISLSLKENIKSTYEALHSAIESVLSPDEVINHIRYEHDSEEMKRKLDSNELQLCFFMNALSKNYFIDMVSRGKLLPPKSTLFYPKLPTGLVIQYLNDI